MPRGKLRAPRDKQRGSWGKQRANLVKQHGRSLVTNRATWGKWDEWMAIWSKWNLPFSVCDLQ